MINDDTLAQLADEREELIAGRETLYNALDTCRRIAQAKQDDALVQIEALVRRTKTELTDMLNAAQKHGLHYELLDEEAMDWYAAVDRQFHVLTAEGKRRYVSARKREALRQSRNDGSTRAQADGVVSAGEGSAASARSLTLHRAGDEDETVRRGGTDD